MTSPQDARDCASCDPVGGLFASRSVAEHLLRGVVGLALLVTALVGAGTSAWFLLLAVVTVVLWRGCPTCWLLGLAATRERTGERTTPAADLVTR